MKKNVLTSNKPLQKTMFPRIHDQLMKEDKSEQLQAIHWASLFVETGLYKVITVVFPEIYGKMSQLRLSTALSICTHSRNRLRKRERNSLWTISSPSTRNVIVLHSISLISTSVATVILSCYRTYTARKITGCNIQKTKTAWVALA